MSDGIISDETECRNLVQRTAVGANGAIALLRLNRPARANAYNNAMLASLEREIRSVAETGLVRAAILTGEGNRAFCAGADKTELKGRRALDGLNLRSREVFELWAALPVPTIAAVNGAAVGGGLELALACDVRVCAANAKFSLPELSLGLTPAAGGMRRLPAIVGKSRAKEMILFGRELDAATALEWGLVAHMGDDFEAMALELAERVTTQDPMATCLAKRVIESDQIFGRHDLEAVVQALLYERKFERGDI